MILMVGAFSTNVFVSSSFDNAAVCFQMIVLSKTIDTSLDFNNARLMLITVCSAAPSQIMDCHIFQLTWVLKTSANSCLSDHIHLPIPSNRLVHNDVQESLVAQQCL